MGVVVFWWCWPLSIVALITGILGRRQAPERGVSPAMATAGLILGIVGMVIAVVYLTLLGASIDS